MEKKNITAGALSRHNWDTRCRNAIINAHVHSLPKKRYARKKIPYFIQINGDCHINRGIQLGDFSPTASRAVSNNKNLVTLIHSLTQLVKQFLGKKKCKKPILLLGALQFPSFQNWRILKLSTNRSYPESTDWRSSVSPDSAFKHGSNVSINSLAQITLKLAQTLTQNLHGTISSNSSGNFVVKPHKS